MAPSCFALLLLLLLQCCSAAKCSVSQQELDRITELPGQPEGIRFAQFSGYVTVNSTNGRAMFYWLVESMKDPAHAPLVLWLNGGPGCSSVAYGMSEELGPFHIRPDGKTLYSNPFAWNRVANVMFLESPAGVGYSYSNTTEDLYNYGDHRTAMDNYHFLVGWFERFPQYKGREFYLAGESYAGHYVPQLAHIIYRANKGIKKPTINFKGFLVGNAVTDDRNDAIGAFEYWWNHGLISDSTYKELRRLCVDQPSEHPSDECLAAYKKSDKESGNIDPYSIYTPICTSSPSTKRTLKGIRRPWMWRAYDPCTENYGKIYYNRPEVQKALHAEVITGKQRWDTCNDIINDNWNDSPISMLPIYRELIRAGLKRWVFSGDTDAVVPLTGTRHSINALKLPVLRNWYPWYHHNTTVGGWCQVYKGLTLVTVRGAGHEVPLHRPTEALILFRHFIQGTPMPT